MTNKEHLATIESLAWVQRVDWLYHCYGKQYTDTWSAIIDWLEKEYTPVTPLMTNMPDETWYYCPVCYTATIKGEQKCFKCCTEFNWKEEHERSKNVFT